jgi:hypothetical protein
MSERPDPLDQTAGRDLPQQACLVNARQHAEETSPRWRFRCLWLYVRGPTPEADLGDRLDRLNVLTIRWLAAEIARSMQDVNSPTAVPGHGERTRDATRPPPGRNGPRTIWQGPQARPMLAQREPAPPPPSLMWRGKIAHRQVTNFQTVVVTN